MLTGKQKRHLRALGHNLKPLILIGKKEIEDSCWMHRQSWQDPWQSKLEKKQTSLPSRSFFEK